MKLNNVGEADYFPSFFTAHLYTKDYIECISPLDSSTLFHEYIHYLQDIFTLHGNRKFLYMNKCIPELRRLLGNKVSRPIKLSNQLISYKKSIDDIDGGCLDGLTASNILSVNNVIFTQTPNLAYFVDQSGMSHSFGVKVIMESMAHLLEVRHPNYDRHQFVPVYPYKIIEQIFGGKVPRGNNTILIILCFIALNCEQPLKAIEFFYNQFNLIPSYHCPKKILGFILHYRKQLTLDVKDVLEQRKNFLLILDKWDSYLLDMGWKIRHSLLQFDLTQREDCINILNYLVEPMFKDVFEKKTSDIGMPLYYNEEYEYSSFGTFPYGDNTTMAYVALKHILVFLLDSKEKSSCPVTRCPYKNNKTQQVCENAPWRFEMNGLKCTFSQLWHNLGYPKKIKFEKG